MADWIQGLSLRAARGVDRWLWDLTPRAKDAPSGAFAIGTVVDGRYELEKMLGEGSFGRVWRARSIEENRLVALKELRGREEQTRDQFESEFLLLSRLKHPNIVRVFDYGETSQGTRYLVMELVPGRDLTEQTKGGPLARADAAKVIAGLLQGLQLLHSRLLVHCDIKTDNIRLTNKSEVKLMDFGLLHQLGTPAAGISGTVVTMSPEMMQGGVIDGRSDLYSVGCLAYELFTGELPFKGDSIAAVMERVLHEAARPPSYFIDLPPEIDRFVLTLLEKKPEARFADASAALRALRDATGVVVEDDAGLHRTSYLFSPELVGRDRERALLDGAREAVGNGKGGALFISGKGGEGKTRLLEELRLKAKLARMQWCAAQCRPGATVPLQPFAEALSALTDRIPESVLQEHGGALAVLLPALRARGVEPLTSADATEQKARLLAGVVAACRAVAEQSPVVIALEDLHVADGGSLELLNHVIRSCGDARVLVVATFGSTEIDRASLAFATIHEGRARLVELAPLDVAALPRLLQLTLGEHALTDDTIARLHAAADGNPLALFEALRALIELGELAPGEGDRWALLHPDAELPKGTAAAFALRFSRMPAPLATSCQGLATMGQLVDARLACAVLGVQRPALQDTLEDLIAFQVLKREGKEIAFANESVRKVIYDAMPDAQKKALHDGIGKHIEAGDTAAGRPEPAAIAFHLRRGAAPPRALPWLFVAAEKLEEKQQPLEAIKLLQEAVAVAQQASGAEKRDNLVRALDKMAGYSNLVPPIAAQAIEQLSGVWKEEIDWRGAAATLTQRKARIARVPAFVRPLLDKRVPFAPSTHAPRALLNRWVQHRVWQGVALAILGNREKAIQAADEAESFLGAIDDPDNLVDLIKVPRTICAVNMGHFDEAFSLVDGIRARLDDVRTPRTAEINYARFWSLYGRNVAEALAGLPLTTDIHQQLLAWLDAWGIMNFKLFGFVPPMIRASLSGEPALFDEQTAGFESLAYRMGFPEPATSRGRSAHPQYFARRGEVDRARPVVARLEKIGAMDKWMACQVAHHKAVLALETGDAASVAPVVDEGLALARTLGSQRIGALEICRAEIMLATGGADAARPIAEVALDVAAKSARKNPLDEALARLALARCLGAGGDGQVTAALDVARASQNRLIEGMAWAVRATSVATGAAAADARARADALFAALGNEHQRKKLAAAQVAA